MFAREKSGRNFTKGARRKITDREAVAFVVVHGAAKVCQVSYATVRRTEGPRIGAH